MKKKMLSVIALGLAVVALSSCDSRERLSDRLKGLWSGTPETLTDTGAERATMVRLMEFVPQENGAGTVTMTAYITVDNTMPANDSIVTPLTISASGTATITGTYQAKDDDDLLLNLDATSLKVNVDPEAVQLNYNVLTGNSGSTVETLRPAAALLASQQIEHAARHVYFTLSQIEDIEFHGDMMTCEMNHRDLSFRLQGPEGSKN